MIIYEEEEFDDDGLYDAINNDDNYLWSLDSATGTVPIPFMIANRVGPEIRDRITKAVLEYDQKTCIR